MGANESVQRQERKASEKRARKVPANSVGVGTHVKSGHADQYGIGRSPKSGDQPVSGTSDCQLTSAMYRWKCLYISWVTLPALLHRLPNVTAYCTHVNMLWHKEERASVRLLISGETQRKAHSKNQAVWPHRGKRISIEEPPMAHSPNWLIYLRNSEGRQLGYRILH